MDEFSTEANKILENYQKWAEDQKLKTLDDFDKYARGHHLNMKNMQVVVQMKILNTGSHFSEDKFNLAMLYGVLFIVFVALLAVNYRKYKEDKERFEEEDSPLYFTMGSQNMIVVHCLLKCFHNVQYAQDGVGSMLCEIMGHITLIFSRITMLTILIAFAFGWQVIYENTKEVKKKIQWIYLFVLGMAAYDDYKLSSWIEEHPGDLFHLLQSDIQWTFYFTKMIEYAIFLFAIWRSKSVAN